MTRSATITDEMQVLAQEIVKKAVTARELRSGLCVLLPKSCNITYEETAQILGIGVATVVRSQRKIRGQVVGEPAWKQSWDGRRRQLLSPAEEENFLAEWIHQAEHGGVFDCSAYPCRTGKAIRAKSVSIYRIPNAGSSWMA